ncbi:UbiE/COQ5 family methyltransferase [Penicillium lividum]|nr:UbiE/COQ5 family methyltransferase [Penicillium lividum]
MNSRETYRSVQSRYAAIAGQTEDENPGRYEHKIAKAFGNCEPRRQLWEPTSNGKHTRGSNVTGLLLDAESNIHLQGEIVIDLGSGGGIDVLLAAKKVGMRGRAIGIDMTKDMLSLARRNAEKAGASNTLFIEAFITSIPLASSTADCIISNCVVNLVPEVEKPLVFQEMFRLLKPGGRVAISDILAKRELPAEVKENLSLYVGCIAGASQVGDYEKYLKEAGFQGTVKVMGVSLMNFLTDTLILDTNGDLNLYKEMWQKEGNSALSLTASCCDPLKDDASGDINELSDMDLNFWTGELV